MTTITADQADDILDASYCAPGETVERFTYVTTIEGDQRRWMQRITIVVSDPEGAFWGLDYDRGLTENQDSHYPWKDYGRTDVNLTRLYPHIVTTTEYRTQPPVDRAHAGLGLPCTPCAGPCTLDAAEGATR